MRLFGLLLAHLLANVVVDALQLLASLLQSLAGLLGYVVLDVVGDDVLVDRDEATIASTTTEISDAYLGPYLVPLIALSFVLLAAAIGAIVLARKD